MHAFDAIYQRAARRKGGEDGLRALLPQPIDREELAATPDSRCLAEMTRCVFQAGFVWKVIEQKWEGFEAAFLGFDPQAIRALSTEDWEAIASDERIVRNRQKIDAVAVNARFVDETSMQYGSFGRFIADWPEDDLVGLLARLKKQGSRLGGHTGQRFLRNIGKDGFILSKDVVACLKDSGLDIGDNPATDRDMRAIQEAFNQWHRETGLPYTQLSKIAAYSIGED